MVLVLQIKKKTDKQKFSELITTEAVWIPSGPLSSPQPERNTFQCHILHFQQTNHKVIGKETFTYSL